MEKKKKKHKENEERKEKIMIDRKITLIFILTHYWPFCIILFQSEGKKKKNRFFMMDRISVSREDWNAKFLLSSDR